ncbi:MAG: glycosyl hydrolase [Saprospirales bacterium]|nr:glycosyl hydrolase [Saprospirales bacterium]
MRSNTLLVLLLILSCFSTSWAQKKPKTIAEIPPPTWNEAPFASLQWRNIGPFRGGRSNAATGVPGNPLVYYFGSTGGGVWKTTDAGISWENISDGFFQTGSVGAIAVAESDPNVLYVGMGEHAVRGVMTSSGDGIYKSTDAGKSWQHIGLENSRHIAEIRIHPTNPDLVYVAVQGELYAPSMDRGVYKSTDGGKTWRRVFFIDNHTGACDLSMDPTNPRILYAGMWDHQRYPWKVRSGGPGSGLWKSTNSGETWEPLLKGLPEAMGKVSVDVSPANPQRIYANIEAEKGGVYRSDNGGETWQQTSSDRVTVTRAWYYTEIFADPQDEETVYVLNAPMLKSIDGGRTFRPIPNPHGDQHHLWINPENSDNMILANDGGACITFNGGETWSTQANQPTAQFYRVITDNRFPYYVYGGQQDNSSVAIPSRALGGAIDATDWYPVAGGESAFLAFDPDNPQVIYGTEIEGMIDRYDHATKATQSIMAYPMLNLGQTPVHMKYRFNWNNPVVAQPQNPRILYHGAQVLLRSEDGGGTWTPISPDLTRNDLEKQGPGGEPYTNEAAGGENYNTISYIACSPHQAGEIWVGTDDGLVYLTRDEGQSWNAITPPNLDECLINAIEVSAHEPGAAYLAVTRYKWADRSPMIYMTRDYGQTWEKLGEGISAAHFVRVVREDPVQQNLLYAGTEGGLYVSFDRGAHWHPFQLNLPRLAITDLAIHGNDLIASTAGRGFWILDDLSSLQQSMGKPDPSHLTLFQPQPAYKFDTGNGPEPPKGRGQNPLNGLQFDYYLPDDWSDNSSLTLEVLDAEGNLLRKLTNQPEKDFKTWPGGPPPPVVLPAHPGLNRFYWDLRSAPLPAVDGVFVMGDYRGSTAGPGNYTLRMTTAAETREVQASILADPRLNATPGDFSIQQEFLSRIDQTFRDVHTSVNRLRSVKSQLEERMKILKKIDADSSLLEAGELTLKALNEWESHLIQPRQQTFQDVINFPNQLNAELLYLKSQADSHDPHLTEGSQHRWEDLQVEWAGQKAEMEHIIEKEVGGFNRKYAALGLPVLLLPGE